MFVAYVSHGIDREPNAAAIAGCKGLRQLLVMFEEKSALLPLAGNAVTVKRGIASPSSSADAVVSSRQSVPPLLPENADLVVTSSLPVWDGSIMESLRSVLRRDVERKSADLLLYPKDLLPLKAEADPALGPQALPCDASSTPFTLAKLPAVPGASAAPASQPVARDRIQTDWEKFVTARYERNAHSAGQLQECTEQFAQRTQVRAVHLRAQARSPCARRPNVTGSPV